MNIAKFFPSLGYTPKDLGKVLSNLPEMQKVGDQARFLVEQDKFLLNNLSKESIQQLINGEKAPDKFIDNLFKNKVDALEHRKKQLSNDKSASAEARKQLEHEQKELDKQKESAKKGLEIAIKFLKRKEKNWQQLADWSDDMLQRFFLLALGFTPSRVQARL